MVRTDIRNLVSKDGTEWNIERLTIQSEASAVRALRKTIREFARSVPFCTEEIAEMEVAFGEACTNALRHGSPRGNNDTIDVVCMRNHCAIIIDICDKGNGFDPKSIPQKNLEKTIEGGMGILLMRALMDSVEFKFEKGTRVRLIKYCRNLAQSNAPLQIPLP